MRLRFDLALVMVYNKLLETSSDNLLVSVAFASAEEAVSSEFREEVMSIDQLDTLINNAVEENYSLHRLVEFRDSPTTSDDLAQLRLLSTAAKQYALIFRETLVEAQVIYN